MNTAKHIVEGKLLYLAIEPGESLIGVMVITADGEQEGRYMRRPDTSYGSFTINGRVIGTIGDLCDAIMEGEYMVKWASELHVTFTKVGA